MAYLFKIEGKLVLPTEETLLTSPYREIWERDNSKGKEQAIKEFTYIEFMTSLLATNPYKGYSEDVRGNVIIRDVFGKEGFKPDKLIEEGMKKIQEFQINASASYRSYASAVKANETLNRFFTTVDLSKVNFKTGNPIYKPKEVTAALLDVEKVAISLEGLRKKVEEELFDAIKTKGQKQISPFAKVESLS